jgi:hypothetical protein
VIDIVAEPKIKITKVCINIYNESKPNILGVNIRLFVIVWNTMVDNAIEVPVRRMASSFILLFGRA